MAEIRLVLKLDGTDNANSLMGQLGSTLQASIQQGMAGAMPSLNQIEQKLQTLIGLVPQFAAAGMALTAGFNNAGQAVSALMARMDQLASKIATVRGGMQSLGLGGAERFTTMMGPEGMSYGGYASASYAPYQRNDSLRNAAMDAQRAEAQRASATNASAGKYGGPQDDLAGKVDAMYASMAQQWEADAKAAKAAHDQAVRQLEAAQSSFQRNYQIQSFAQDVSASEAKRSKFTEAAASRYEGATDPRIDELTDSIFGYFGREAGEEKARVAADRESRAALVNASSRRSELRSFASDASAAQAARGRETEGAVSRYEGAPVPEVDALMANIMGQGKLQGQAQKAAERADAIASKVAQKEFDSIVQAIEQMGEYEKTSGVKIAEEQRRAGDRLQNLDRAQNLLGQGGALTAGYRQTGQQIGANGVQSESYSRAAGLFRDAETFNINRQTGEFTRNVQSMSNAWARFQTALVGNGSEASKIVNGLLLPLRGVEAGIRKLGDAWNWVGNNLIRVSALFYSAERAFNLVKGAVVGPYEAILNQGEQAEKFRMSIAGTVGGMGNATAIDNAMIPVARSSPFTIEQVRQMASRMVGISPLASQMAVSTPTEAAGMAGQFADIVGRLSIANPTAAPEKVGEAVGNALIGNLRNLRFIAHVDPRDLAAIAGKSEKELQADQHALLQALQTIARIRTPDSVLAAQSNLPSVQIEKIGAEFHLMLQRISEDSGLFTTVTNRFRSMLETMEAYVDSPESREQAKQLGDDFSGIFENLIHGGGEFIRALSGADSVADSPKKFADQIGTIVHAIQVASAEIPPLAAQVGGALGFFSSEMVDLAKHAREAATVIAEARDVLSFLGGAVKGDPKAMLGSTARFFADAAAGPNGTAGPGQTFTREEEHRKWAAQNTKNFSDAGIADLAGAGVRANPRFAYAAPLENQNRIAGELSAMLPGKVEQWAGDLAKIGEAMDSLSAMSPEKLASFRDRRIGQIQSQYRGDTETLFGPDGSERSSLDDSTRKQLRQQLAQADQAIEVLTSGYDDALKDTSDKLRKGIAEATAKFLIDLKGEDVSVRVAEYARAASGLTSLPLALQGKLQSQDVQDQLALIDQQSKRSGIAQQGSLLGGGGVLDLKASALRGALPGAEGLRDRAFSQYQQDGTPEARVAYEQADAAVQKLTADLKQLEQAGNRGLESAVQFGNQVQHSFEKGVGEMFASLITGAHNFADIMRNLAKSMLNDFTQSVSQMLFRSVFGNPSGGVGVGNGIGGLLGGLFGGLIGRAGGGGANPIPVGAQSVMGSDVIVAAHGGIFRSGISFFSSGGIAHKPMLGMVGERSDGVPEAVIPMLGHGGTIPLGMDGSGLHAILPGNRKIPAAMFANGGVATGGFGGSSRGLNGGFGGGGQNVEVHVHNHNYFDRDQMAAYTAGKFGHHIKNDVLNDFRPGGAGRRMLAKPT